jgi:hypothetical protein
MTERQECIQFIKKLYPIGSIVDDPTCSELYKINKRTVFKVFIWKAEDYNDMMRPKDEKNYYVEFRCHDPGKHTREYSIGGVYEKRHIISKFKRIA